MHSMLALNRLMIQGKIRQLPGEEKRRAEILHPILDRINLWSRLRSFAFLMMELMLASVGISLLLVALRGLSFSPTRWALIICLLLLALSVFSHSISLRLLKRERNKLKKVFSSDPDYQVTRTTLMSFYEPGMVRRIREQFSIIAIA
jgi:hypothetical protein